MAKAKSKVPSGTTRQASLSNLPADAAKGISKRSITKPKTTGQGGSPASAGGGGYETVAVRPHSAAESMVAARGDLAVLRGRFKPPASADLRDIGEASFGTPPAVAESVIGQDDRVQITATTQYPWRAIASLVITARDNSVWIGTGWFISPRTLITAGHCVYIHGNNPNRNGWVKQIQVMAGRDGGNLPYGSVTSDEFNSVEGWVNDGDENFDYGAITLPVPLGDTVGVFGFGVFADGDLQNSPANISGYPGDKPQGTQWYDARTIVAVNHRKVYYDIDTAGGQSGAPVIRIVGGQRVAVAVHAYGGHTSNSGTRINDTVYARMKSWMR
jgi:V8-like Glu-specific endopeptidase